MIPSITPPRLPRALLRFALPDDARDAIDGDLHELYVTRRAASGAAAATAWYWFQSLSFVVRFSLDRLARAIRGLAAGDSSPSVLDLKLGGRLLAKSPGLALVGGFGIAIAVALGAGAYAVVNSYFYPEVPLHEGDRIVALGKFDPLQRRENEQLLHDFLVWRRELRLVVDLGAFRTVRRNLFSESGQGEPITLAEMSASGFRVAQVPPLLGRALLDVDERPGAPLVMVIGYDVWQSRFARDPRIVGRQIRIGRGLYTIVGVMPEGFAFPINHQYWLPLRVDPGVPVGPGAGPSLDVFGRLASGATREMAQAELSVLARRLAAEGPTDVAPLQSRIVPYTDIFLKSEAEGENVTYAIVRFLIALFLIIVAMNVAVLVYARTVMRTGEIAVRTALGATRTRIVMQFFAEAFVLSGISAIVGLGVVAVGLRMFDRALAGYYERAPFWMHSGLSAGTVVYAFALAVMAAVIVGVLPALRATGVHLRAAMGSLGSGAKARLGPTWTVLIVAQVTVTVAVLPLALLKGAEMVQHALREPGFAPGEYLSTRFVVERDAEATAQTGPSDKAAGDSAHAIISAFVTRLATEPGVVGATVTVSPPWEGGAATVEVDGVTSEAQRATSMTVDTSFFGLFKVRVLAGRVFAAADAALPGPDRPVIVNRAFADEIFGGADPVGKRVRYRSYGPDVQPWFTIAGVVENFPSAINARKGTTRRSARVYHLALPGEWSAAMLTVRLRGTTPEAFAPTLRRVAGSVDPTLQISNPSTLDAMWKEFAKSGAQLALLVALVTTCVILLSAAGIHALMSFAVNQRRREIGIRSALGAPARQVLTSVLSHATRQLALGVGIGLTVAVIIDQLSEGAMMSGAGLLLVPATAAFMLVVGFLAAAGPARSGLRVQPTEALRAE